MTKTKTALVVITEGTEEMEAVITIDVLRRAGITVTIGALPAGAKGAVEGTTVRCSCGILIQADTVVTESVSESDIVILPGGMPGSKHFADSPVIGHLLQRQQAAGKLIAAICAAPIALKSHGIASGKRVTSYPSFADELKSAGFQYSEDRVVVDGDIITSRGPGTAFEFALAIVKKLLGHEKAEQTAAPLLLK